MLLPPTKGASMTEKDNTVSEKGKNVARRASSCTISGVTGRSRTFDPSKAGGVISPPVHLSLPEPMPSHTPSPATASFHLPWIITTAIINISCSFVSVGLFRLPWACLSVPISRAGRPYILGTIKAILSPVGRVQHMSVYFFTGR